MNQISAVQGQSVGRPARARRIAGPWLEGLLKLASSEAQLNARTSLTLSAPNFLHPLRMIDERCKNCASDTRGSLAPR
jgi:hypothetical protein